MANFALRFEDDLKKKLQEKANEENKSMNQVIVEAIEKYLNGGQEEVEIPKQEEEEIDYSQLPSWLKPKEEVETPKPAVATNERSRVPNLLDYSGEQLSTEEYAKKPFRMIWDDEA